MVSNWENGYDIIPLTKLIKLCNLYNYSIDFIVGFTRSNNFIKITDKLDKVIIGRKLKNLRMKLGFSQQQIADECSIARATYSHYELGISLVSTLTLYTICKNHKISMDWFLND